MLGFSRTFYPTKDSISWLSNLSGFHSWHLSEIYSPTRVSTGLSAIPSFLSPDLLVSGSQWLIQAPSSANVSLQSGLLFLGSRCVYESNVVNVPNRYSRLIPSNSRPPGWWHRKRSPERHQSPLLFLTTHNNPNYFHWLTQPGLASLFLHDYFDVNLHTMSLACSHRPRCSLPSFVLPMLDMFAPSFAVTSGLSITSDSFSLFSLQEYTSQVFVSPAQLHWLNRRCRDRLHPSSKPWRRILISRQRSSRRRCINEDQLLSALAPYHFERHFLEDLSVIEQLRLFSESIIVLGAHGAGLSNIVACPPNCTIVELFPYSGPLSHYYLMADALGLKHGHLIASSCNPQTDDFVVQPSDLMQLLGVMELL